MNRAFLPILGSMFLLSLEPGHGLATEQIGPDSAQDHPTTAQPGWPAGMLALVQHPSRVYSRWVNGHENFHFHGGIGQVNELVEAFTSMRIRDHEIIVKEGAPEVSPFSGGPIRYNIQFTFLGGIARGFSQSKQEALTLDPTLTLHLPPAQRKEWLQKLVVPGHAIIRYEIEGAKIKNIHQKPARQLWHAKVLFEGGKPATDYEANVSTRVHLWEEHEAEPIYLGTVSNKGLFHTAFSEPERADLVSGKSWLTLTTGNYSTKPKKTHPRLPAANLHLDPDSVPATTLLTPRYYYGRILFEDGSPPDLNPEPWPGAKIKVNFSYVGAAELDPEGYFRVFFTPGQIKELRAKKKDRRNIYVPSYEKQGRSSAKYVFPVGALSQSKDEAGIVKIPNPALGQAEEVPPADLEDTQDH